MKNFKNLTDLPVFIGIDKLILEMTETNLIEWGIYGQVCINAPPGFEDDYTLGTGSLVLNWNNAKSNQNKDGTVSINIEPIINQLDVKTFTKLCTQFHGTPFEQLYECLYNKYTLGRVRLMRSQPKTCLTWHTDATPRVHYPIITYPGCIMVVDTEAFHMPKNTWWEVNTTKYHTAFNGSLETRIHLVAEIFDHK
jgi:hypothetical protein